MVLNYWELSFICRGGMRGEGKNRQWSKSCLTEPSYSMVNINLYNLIYSGKKRNEVSGGVLFNAIACVL